MNDEHPTQPEVAAGNSLPDKSGLSGLTDAVGGLDSVSGEPAVPDHDPLLGKDIGGVTIVKLIAEGGMGRVYEGLQARPRRPVAVKVMRPGFVSREACRRFDNESEVLGRLRHQYIAQIFSAGMCNVVGAQVPYFIMEYIPDALPLTNFAAARKLSTEQRLELFRKVCEAVAHGHENNVIHRDLKPSNILVEPSGVPKVIDFGVSRCVDATPEAMTALTDMGQLIGTVQYMSPEQFSADPSAVDVRADVYALGVILYELLTGKPPYEIKHKQIFEAAKVVREQKPVSPAKLNRSVQPDLVKITGTCLQKDRRRRYASAAELANAVGSYLGGAPVPQPSRSIRDVFAEAFGRWWDSRLAIGSLAVALPLLGIAAIGWWWLQQPAPPAPPSEPIVIQFNGHAYRVFLEPATQSEAAERCRKQGGYLAQIETAAENAAVLAAALKSETGPAYLWIAGYRPKGTNDWLFETKNEPMTFFHRGIDRLNASDEGPCALAIAVDSPIAYWQALNHQTRTAGFICEWNDYMTPQGRAEP
jgi:serine/threonine protein kinase